MMCNEVPIFFICPEMSKVLQTLNNFINLSLLAERRPLSSDVAINSKSANNEQ
jgi:hypothetical protein